MRLETRSVVVKFTSLVTGVIKCGNVDGVSIANVAARLGDCVAAARLGVAEQIDSAAEDCDATARLGVADQRDSAAEDCDATARLGVAEQIDSAAEDCDATARLGVADQFDSAAEDCDAASRLGVAEQLDSAAQDCDAASRLGVADQLATSRTAAGCVRGNETETRFRLERLKSATSNTAKVNQKMDIEKRRAIASSEDKYNALSASIKLYSLYSTVRPSGGGESPGLLFGLLPVSEACVATTGRALRQSTGFRPHTLRHWQAPRCQNDAATAWRVPLSHSRAAETT